jgi:hypothetical protein
MKADFVEVPLFLATLVIPVIGSLRDELPSRRGLLFLIKTEPERVSAQRLRFEEFSFDLYRVVYHGRVERVEGIAIRYWGGQIVMALPG